MILSRNSNDLLSKINSWKLVFILDVLDWLNYLLLSMWLLRLSKIVWIFLLYQLLEIYKIAAAFYIKVNWAISTISWNWTVFHWCLLVLSLVYSFVINIVICNWLLWTWHLRLCLPSCAIMSFKISKYLRIFWVLLLSYYWLVTRLSHYILFLTNLI